MLTALECFFTFLSATHVPGGRERENKQSRRELKSFFFFCSSTTGTAWTFFNNIKVSLLIRKREERERELSQHVECSDAIVIAARVVISPSPTKEAEQSATRELLSRRKSYSTTLSATSHRFPAWLTEKDVFLVADKSRDHTASHQLDQ